MSCQFFISKPSRTEKEANLPPHRKGYSFSYTISAWYRSTKSGGQQDRIPDPYRGRATPGITDEQQRVKQGHFNPSQASLSVPCGVGRTHLPTFPPAEKGEYPLIFFFSEMKADSATHCKTTAISDNLSRGQGLTGDKK